MKSKRREFHEIWWKVRPSVSVGSFVFSHGSLSYCWLGDEHANCADGFVPGHDFSYQETTPRMSQQVVDGVR